MPRAADARKREPSRFTQADVQRAIRGATAAGLEIAAVRIDPDGSIHILTTKHQNADDEPNSWDS